MGGCLSSPSSSSAANANASNLVDSGNSIPHATAQVLERVDTQRRRLSISPRLVGDVEGHRVHPQIQFPSAAASGGDNRRLTIGPHVPDHEVEVDLDDMKKDQVDYKSERFAVLTKKGFVPYNTRKVNQDSYITRASILGNEGIALFGVCDGHGEHGHQVSAFVREKLPVVIESFGQDAIKSDPEKCIGDAVRLVCEEMARTKINVAVSGTTAVFGLRVDNKLYSANIGDSRCVLARKYGDEVVVVPLSQDHKPDLPEEKARILERGGRVETLPGPPGADLGPYRVWLKDFDIPGLAMSRSIGDSIGHGVGVISTPEIRVHDIDQNDWFIIWATDGVWEFVSNEEAVHIVKKYMPNLDDACQLLVSASEQYWKKNESVVDDITCVILQVQDL